MRIGIAQIDTRAGDFEATAGRMIGLSARAAREGADLLVFPMASLTGPTPVRESEEDDFLVDAMEALVRMSEEVACPCIVPVVGSVDGEPTPEAVLMGEGRLVPLKMRAYADSVSRGMPADEDGPAPDLPTVEIAGMRLGIAFTYDDLDDYDDFDIPVDAVVYIAGYGYAMDDPDSALGANLAEGRYVSDARTTGAWIVGVGSLGGYGTSVHTGSSFVISPKGDLRCSLPSFEEDLQVCELADDDDVAPLTPEVWNGPLYTWQALVLGLGDYLRKLDKRQAVLALDGSVGSMVAAALATDALGPTNVHAIVDVPGDVAREACCQRLARNLRIDVRDAQDMRAAQVVTDARDATLRRGIVGAYLAAWAEELDALVLSGADKTALALGERRFVPEADALKPVGDVYRSDLLELMRMRNTMSPVFPAVRLWDREVPMAGERDESVAEESWCQRIDQVLADHIEYGRSVTEAAAAAADGDLAQRVLRRLDQSEPWRIGRGLYLMVSSVTLFDARRPLGMAWENRVRTEAELDRSREVERLASRMDRTLGMAALQAHGTGDGDSSLSPAEGDASANTGNKGEKNGAPRQGDDRKMREALSFLRDFSYFGGFKSKGDGTSGSEGAEGGQGGFEDSDGRKWPSPFSEN